MSSIQEINRFIFNANSALSNKNLPGKPEYRQVIKELTDPQRKTLLQIIKNPAKTGASETASLADAIQNTQDAMNKGTFQTRREVGLWKKICRIFSNIFQGRTRSSDVEKSLKAIKQSPLSAKKLTKINQDLKKLYDAPEDLNDFDVSGRLLFNAMTAKSAPLNAKVYHDQIFNYEVGAVDPVVVGLTEMGGVSFSEDKRGKARNDALCCLGMDDIGNGFALLNGWGGQAAKNYLEEHLLDEVHQELNKVKDNLSDANIYNALNRAFLSCNKNWFISQERLANEAEALSNSSALVALLIADNLWIANVGTTRALLITDKTQQLSSDAYVLKGLEGKAWDPANQIWDDSTISYVSKVFGGFNFEGMTAEPQITKVSAPKGKVVLGSDGLFSIASSEEVGNYVRACNTSENYGAKLTNRVINGYADDPNSAPSSSIITISL